MLRAHGTPVSKAKEQQEVRRSGSALAGSLLKLGNWQACWYVWRSRLRLWTALLLCLCCVSCSWFASQRARLRCSSFFLVVAAWRSSSLALLLGGGSGSAGVSSLFSASFVCSGAGGGLRRLEPAQCCQMGCSVQRNDGAALHGACPPPPTARVHAAVAHSCARAAPGFPAETAHRAGHAAHVGHPATAHGLRLPGQCGGYRCRSGAHPFFTAAAWAWWLTPSFSQTSASSSCMPALHRRARASYSSGASRQQRALAGNVAGHGFIGHFAEHRRGHFGAVDAAPLRANRPPRCSCTWACRPGSSRRSWSSRSWCTDRS